MTGGPILIGWHGTGWVTAHLMAGRTAAGVAYATETTPMVRVPCSGTVAGRGPLAGGASPREPSPFGRGAPRSCGWPSLGG
jgi:hypothetical protein